MFVSFINVVDGHNNACFWTQWTWNFTDQLVGFSGRQDNPDGFSSVLNGCHPAREVFGWKRRTVIVVDVERNLRCATHKLDWMTLRDGNRAAVRALFGCRLRGTGEGEYCKQCSKRIFERC
jgi:hypothetical protein